MGLDFERVDFWKAIVLHGLSVAAYKIAPGNGSAPDLLTIGQYLHDSHGLPLHIRVLAFQ